MTVFANSSVFNNFIILDDYKKFDFYNSINNIYLKLTKKLNLISMKNSYKKSKTNKLNVWQQVNVIEKIPKHLFKPRKDKENGKMVITEKEIKGRQREKNYSGTKQTLKQ